MLTQVLTPEQVQRLHEGSLRILRQTGVHIPHPEMLARFTDAGASVDMPSSRVRIPPDLVQRCLDSCAKQFTLYGRDLSQVARFGQGARNYNSIAGEAHWVEQLGGRRRPATIADVGVAARLADALNHINIAGAMSDPDDVPPGVRCIRVMAELLRNTSKPITFWLHDRRSARYLIELLVALRGDEKRAAQYPAFYPFLEPISPLRFPFNGVDLLFETARLNLPVPVGPMAQMGLSAPATLAGTMAQENAEILAGICVVQLIREGTPVCYGGICHAFDMRTTQLIFSGPEQAIFGVAMTQMGKRYGLPVYINVGLTDSKRVDAQAGLEAGLSLALGAAAGADIFGHLGIVGADHAASPDMLVFHDEVVGFVESALREMEFSDEALGLDVIDRVGPGGSFIGEEHTVRHFRQELWFPGLLDREFYQAWLEAGATDMETRCEARRRRLAASHAPAPLPEEVDAAFEDIIRAADRETAR